MSAKHAHKVLKRASSLAFWAVLLLAAAALASGVALWYFKGIHDRAVRVAATAAVVSQGEQMVNYLAEVSPFSTTNLSAEEWRLFYSLVDGLHAAQRDLQYISVVKDGITIISRQPKARPKGEGAAAPRVRISCQRHELGGVEVPVMVFHREAEVDDAAAGGRMDFDVALRLNAVAQEEGPAARALQSLFRLSLLTMVAAFSACLVMLLWMVRRDRAQNERRRQEEHLAFSGMLANGIVHDFRNPMSSVRLDAQMLEREVNRADGARAARMSELAVRIGRTVGRMDKVFQEFLYLARPADEAREAVDLTPCVRECFETLTPRFEQAGLTPEIIWPTAPPPVMASPFALRRALLNVLLNAVQFSPAGRRVEVDARVRDGMVELDVMDRGPGIPEAERRRIFDMFVTSRPEGTGLGLFLARTAVRKCGGDIVALPRAGGGTVIRFTLGVAPIRSGGETQTAAP